jgi:benzodiazapine receptor
MNKNFKLKWWQIALASVVISGLGRLSGGTSAGKNIKTYKKLKQAPWAPPGWVFAPAWTLNNYFIISALLMLLVEDRTSNRKKLLTLQALLWTIFFSFNYVYFKKRSPLLAAFYTVSDAVIALLSYQLAGSESKKLAGNYLPLLGWTTYAGTIAVYQALYNDDPVFETKALRD